MGSRASKRRGICYIAPDVAIPYPSGASVHVMELASNLGHLGHNVHVIARRGRNDAPLEKADGYTIHRVHRWIFGPGPSRGTSSTTGTRTSPLHAFYYGYLRTVFALYVSLIASSVIRKNGLDAIVERETAFGAGGLASEMTQRPLVLEIIGPRYSRLSAQRSSKILYYTDSMLRDWVDRAKCLQVPAGVNTGLFRPDEGKRNEVRRSLGFGSGDTVVGYVGSFQGWHGVDVLLEACSLMDDAKSRLRLLLVGPAPKSYEDEAAARGIGGLVRFIGPLPYELVPGYINSCDILVAPYAPAKDPLREKFGIGWPLKVLEYMACGKPVISTRVAPVDAIVKEQETGLLVEPGNAKALASAISVLMSDPGLAHSISSKGKALVDSNYSWASVASLFSKVVEDARLVW